MDVKSCLAADCVLKPSRCRCLKGHQDLNRDFPDRYTGDGKLTATGKEQKETAAIMQWTLKTGFVASASVHEVSMWVLNLTVALVMSRGSSARCWLWGARSSCLKSIPLK